MKILFLNFADCAENVHFESEMALACRRENMAMVSLHDIVNNKRYFPLLEGIKHILKRRPVSGTEIKDIFSEEYRAAFFLDFPQRKRASFPFLKLIKRLKCPKIFILNHLFPLKKQNFIADMSFEKGLLSLFDEVYFLKYDDMFIPRRLGIGPEKLRTRDYCVDTNFYSYMGFSGKYVFSGGSAGRDFVVLSEAAAELGKNLHIVSRSSLSERRGKEVFHPFSDDPECLRSIIRDAEMTVVPIIDGYKNRAVGNSIVFLSMAMGKIVLTRKTRYIGQFIKCGESGFLYDRLNKSVLISKMKEILSLPPDEKERISVNARKSVERKASLGRFCLKLLRKIRRF